MSTMNTTVSTAATTMVSTMVTQNKRVRTDVLALLNVKRDDKHIKYIHNHDLAINAFGGAKSNINCPINEIFVESLWRSKSWRESIFSSQL